MQIKPTAFLTVHPVRINVKAENSLDWEDINIFQQTSLYSLQIAIPQMRAKYPLELLARATLLGQIIDDLLLTLTIMNQNSQKWPKQAWLCNPVWRLLCRYHSQSWNFSSEFSLLWLLWTVDGQAVPLWHTTFSAQTYLSSPTSSERLEIRSRWNEFF